MSKAEELAKSMEGMFALEPEDRQVIAHLRALDASHRQLLEALEKLLDREWQDDEGMLTLETAREKSRTAIAAAKELT